jgi:hypothetical protein
MGYIYAVIVALLLAGCEAKTNGVPPFSRTSPVMKTHCIGHALVDLPGGYSLTPGALGMFLPDQDEVEDAGIDLLLMPRTTVAEFDKQVSDRQAELVAFDGGTTNKLTLVKKLEGGETLFRVLKIGDAYETEVHFIVKDNYLIARISSYNNQVLKSEALLVDFIGRIGAARSNASPGSFCLGDVVVQGHYRSESATLRFVDPGVRDVAFSAEVDTFAEDPGESLLQRVAGPGSLLRKFDVRESVLRKGERKVAGMRAQEWLASVKLGHDRDEKQLGFNLETMRPKPSPVAPSIHWEMESKGSHALDEKGALQLWDKVTGSIRIRQKAGRYSIRLRSE